MRLLKKNLRHIVEGITGKILGLGQNQKDVELVPIADGTDTVPVVICQCAWPTHVCVNMTCCFVVERVRR
jgi:hypothetical protein